MARNVFKTSTLIALLVGASAWANVDLKANSITATSSNPAPDGSVTITPNFTNLGTDAVPSPVPFNIRISRDIILDSSDAVLYSGTATLGASPSSYNLPVTVTLPKNVLGGNVYWFLEVNPATSTSAVAEDSRTNNVINMSSPMLIQQADLQANAADLVEASTGISTRYANIGEPARFVVTTTNVGRFTAIPTKTAIVISKDKNFSLLPGADMILEPVDPHGMDVGALQAGGSFTRNDQIVVKIPTTMWGQPITTGDYYFFAVTDAHNAINEENEANNSIGVIGPVRLRSPASDYKVLSVSAPASASAGEQVEIFRNIANVGTTDGAEVEYRCFASPNTILSTSDFALPFVEAGGEATVLSRTVQLARGISDKATETVLLPSTMPAGSYYIGCMVDPTGAVAELDETNNAAVTSSTTTVAAQSFQILTTQIPDANVGLPYNVKVATTGATDAVTFKSRGDMGGLTVSADGVITGTPTQPGLLTFTLAATSGRATAETVLTLRVMPSTTQLTITSTYLPPLINNPTIAYSAVLSAAGGVAPYKWTLVGSSLTGGGLPGGLVLDAASGYISGMPRSIQPQDIQLTFKLSDKVGTSITKQLKLRVLTSGALAIGQPMNWHDGMVDRQYLGSLRASNLLGGEVSGPLTWSVVRGALPPGLKLNPVAPNFENLTIDGTPTVAGNFAFTLQVTDTEQRFDTIDMVLTVYSQQLRVFADALPTGLHKNSAVDFAIQTDSTGAVTYELYSGELPKGLKLSSDGKVTGTIADEDSTFGSHSIVVQATDARGARGMGVFNLEVVPEIPPASCSSTPASSAVPGAVLALVGLATLMRRRAKQN